LSDEELLMFEIAYSLGIPVYKLLKEMPYEEFLSWISFFEARPIGWREDLRTAYIMRSFGDKRQPSEIFPSVKAVYSARSNDAMASLKGSFLFNKMLSAKGGDKIEALENRDGE
jgi:hypothetical protein